MADKLTDEEFDTLVNKHLGWIHVIEGRHINRRMTNEEIMRLFEMIYANGWGDYIQEQQDTLKNWEITQQQWQRTQEDMQRATDNFCEGLEREEN